MSPQVQWLTPSPLWDEFAANTDKTAFRSPALLRFATDTFMEDLQSLLANNPGSLRSYIAQPENWRNPTAGLPPLTAAGTSASTANQDQSFLPLKLFHAVHARFYLVSASLNCRLPGLPDHTVKANKGERVTFVVRKLQLKTGSNATAGVPFDTSIYDEYAFTAAGPAPGWILASASSVATGEDQLPLFNFNFGSNGKSRRLFAGVIPVGKRQTYVGGRALQAGSSGTISMETPDDPRKIDFQFKVLDPWADMVDWYDRISSQDGSDRAAAAQGSAFILIDFAHFLSDQIPLVWAAIQNPGQTLTGAQLDLYNALSATVADYADATRPTLAQAILEAFKRESDFDAQVMTPGVTLTLPAGYPGPMLTDLSDSKLADLIGKPADADPLPQRKIQKLIEAALDEVGSAPASVVPPPAKDPQNPQGNDWYIVRCVYERPQCAITTRASAITIPSPPLISLPSLPFQLASYFDPDAPARMLQVALPVDTTPAALRKYPKNVAFMISDQLGQQIKRVSGLKDLMAGNLGDSSGFGLGMICSLSIPIITICAFIVLLIFLILLNIIFFWLPFFKICFPLPTFKAKS